MMSFRIQIAGLDQHYLDIFNDPNIDGFFLRGGKLLVRISSQNSSD